MPSYFFHLKLELYPSPAHTRSSNKRRQLLSPRPSKIHDSFVPPPGSDIFKTRLPVHRTSGWTQKRGLTPPSTQSSPRQPSPGKQNSGSHGDALLLPERNLSLREHPAPPQSPTLPATKHSNQLCANDWRYERVTIESVDMELSGSANKAGKSSVSGLHTKAVYLPSEPKTTDVGWGVVHLYRDTEESAILNGDEGHGGRKSLDRAPRKSEQEEGFDVEVCTTLCILAVPSWMMPSDLLGFVGEQAREDVSHFRLIRTGRTNKYMVLMKFRSAKKAKEWQKVYNGRLFSSAEPENCHVVFIKSVEFLSPDMTSDGDGSGSFPGNTNDPFTTPPNGRRASKSLSSKPLAPPPPNLLELPTCPVCLERMDETTGLLTILCQHVFHCACLEKWRGSGCPVCRYTHSPSYTFPYPRPQDEETEQEEEPYCSVCATDANLWICLICGNIGCGRYDSAHAFAHYEETSHCYAMDISTQHVWDYAGDGYVHRLIQSKPDTSSSAARKTINMIDLPERRRHENEAFRAEGGESVPREKMEAMGMEYTFLLTSQLEGQRRYFEEQVERAVDKASQASLRAEEAVAAAEKTTIRDEEREKELQTLQASVGKLEIALEKEKQVRAKFEAMARNLSTQLREEKTMSEGLMKRLEAEKVKAEKAKQEVQEAREKTKELEDMNHDLTMFISSQEKVKELQAQGEEVVEGGIGVVDGPKKKGKGRKK